MTDTPKRKIAVLYHADTDGFGSAYAIWKALNATCELLFLKVQYGQVPPAEALFDFNPDKMYIVDFSYPADMLKTLQELYTKDLTVFDHHKTSLPELQKWVGASTDCREFINEGGGSYFHDETLAGCTLVWQMFHLDPEWMPEAFEFQPSLPAPDILLYVADRDLWKFELEHSKEINAYIATLDEDFDVWDEFYTPEAYDCGRALLRFQQKQIKGRVKDVRMVAFGTDTLSGAFKFYHLDLIARLLDYHEVPIVNASENISELGEELCRLYPDSPFSISYCDRADGKRSYSLRSRNGFDVSVVAKAFNGGGHSGAAGFTLNAPDII